MWRAGIRGGWRRGREPGAKEMKDQHEAKERNQMWDVEETGFMISGIEERTN